VEASAAARSSETRRTAADYAELGHQLGRRSAGVAPALRALEAEERQRTSAYRCPDCGDIVSRRSLLRFFWERAASGQEDNPLLKRFFARECYWPLLESRYHQVNDHRHVRKELSESLALLEALAAAVPDFGAHWHVVDLCCGRSLTSGLAALEHPGLAITAVDRLEPKFLPHFGAMGVRYVQLDVLAEWFPDELARLVAQAGRPVAVLGMHLCGALSLRAIEAFAHLGSAAVGAGADNRALVLSPCCLPSRAAGEAPAHVFASRDGAAQYAAWAAHLEAELRRASPDADVTAGPVAGILSPKNRIICASVR